MSQTRQCELEKHMALDDRLEQVRAVYEAFASGDRGFLEATFTDDFRFSSPLDVGLDRAGYFERCWPGAGRGQSFEFVRLVESGDEVIATYEMTRREQGQEHRDPDLQRSSDLPDRGLLRLGPAMTRDRAVGSVSRSA
jgi:hypothetical protein